MEQMDAAHLEAVIAALADPDRGFDAIMAGEAERAFYGPQYEQMAPLFARHGMQVWVPDVGGPVDPEIGSLEELMALLGILSKREIVRARIRTMTSMTILTGRLGRFLDGRAPYGYRLVPIKPHPNPTHARWGRMQLGPAPDPTIGPIVEWMFVQRLAGMSYARIARALNDAYIPTPSAADRERNRHRAGLAWTVTSVAAILTICRTRRIDQRPESTVSWLACLSTCRTERRWHPRNCGLAGIRRTSAQSALPTRVPARCGLAPDGSDP